MAIVRSENVVQEPPWDIDPNSSTEEQVRSLMEAYRHLWTIVKELKDLVYEHDEQLQ